jgi:uncharacterized SAM-binding protein YcdF (DUF218 family)
MGRDGLFVVALLGTVVVIYAINLLMSTAHRPEQKDPIIIIVPGGGLMSDGTLPLYSEKRMQKAAELFHSYESAKQPSLIITLSAGTPHKPNPLDTEGFPLYESSMGLNFLIQSGIPANKIFEEKLSLDTIGNVCTLLLATLYISHEVHQ